MHSTVVSLVWNNTMSLLWEIKAIFVIKRAIISAIERDCHVNLFISLIWLQEQRIMVNFFVLQHVRCYYQVLLAHVSIASNKESPLLAFSWTNGLATRRESTQVGKLDNCGQFTQVAKSRKFHAYTADLRSTCVELRWAAKRGKPCADFCANFSFTKVVTSRCKST